MLLVWASTKVSKLSGSVTKAMWSTLVPSASPEGAENASAAIVVVCGGQPGGLGSICWSDSSLLQIGDSAQLSSAVNTNSAQVTSPAGSTARRQTG